MPGMHFPGFSVPADWETDFESRKTVESEMPYEQFTGAFRISPNDKRQYRLLRLPNNMVVVCVCDQDAKQAAAVVSVNIGYFADPPELPGLAHFLEHMLFRGSKKYPKENEYDEYINNNSGSFNASTSADKTVYHFAIHNDALEGALDRLSRFFIEPLMDANCVDREVLAVDSEFKGNLRSDSKRSFVMSRVIAKQSHPFAKFGTGNKQTLADAAANLGLNLRDELLKFHSKHYSADVMQVVVVGNHSLDKLTEWTVSMFSDVESKGDTMTKIVDHPFGVDELGKMVHYESIGDTNRIWLLFPIPEIKSLYKNDPRTYMDYMLLRCDKGSLYAYLKALGWATSVGAMVYQFSIDVFNIYYITINATPEGMNHVTEIVQSVFAYLRMLEIVGPQEWYHEELRTISNANFQYYTPQGAYTWAFHIMEALYNQYMPPQDIIYQNSPLGDMPGLQITQFLEMLTPNNYTLVLQSKTHKDVECTSEEKYYGIKYHISDLPPSLATDLTIDETLLGKFSMPRPNPYIPENLDVQSQVVEKIATEPTLLKLTDKVELWFKKDDQFFVPRGRIQTRFQFNEPTMSPHSSVVASLYINYVSDYIGQELDEVLSAGLDFSISMSYRGIFVDVWGFNDKMPYLTLEILRQMKDIVIDPKLFEIRKTRLKEMYNDKIHMSALKQINCYRDTMSYSPLWHYSVLAEQVDQITADNIQELASRVFDKTFAKVLVTGNFNEPDVLDTAKQIETVLDYKGLPASMHSSLYTIQFDPGHFVLQFPMPDKKSKNSAVICQINCEFGDDYHAISCLILIGNIIHEAFFDQLRTKEQLGYEVGVSTLYYEQHKGVVNFYIQGERSPSYMTKRIELFIAEFRQRLVDYGEEMLQNMIKSSVDLWLEKKKSIYEEASVYWYNISQSIYDFGYVPVLIECIKETTVDHLVAFWDKYINPDTSSNYKRIDYEMWSSKVVQPTIKDMESYPLSVIAFHDFLTQAGLENISFADIYEMISDSVGLTDIDLVTKLKTLTNNLTDSEKIIASFKENESIIQTALEAALKDQSIA
ncbi:metalloprotease [Coemansia sp. Benny D115]|nr:metalloprotease [Coemansia sp. Benny D115]